MAVETRLRDVIMKDPPMSVQCVLPGMSIYIHCMSPDVSKSNVI